MENEESCQEDNKNWGVQILNIKFYLDDLEDSYKINVNNF